MTKGVAVTMIVCVVGFLVLAMCVVPVRSDDLVPRVWLPEMRMTGARPTLPGPTPTATRRPAPVPVPTVTRIPVPTAIGG